VKRYAGDLFLTFCMFVLVISTGSSDSFALDPRFELDTRALGGKKPTEQKAASVPRPEVSPGKLPAAEKKIEGTRASMSKTHRKPSRGKKSSRARLSGQGAKHLRTPHSAKREQACSTAFPGTVVHSFRMSAGRDKDIRWTKNVWDRLLGRGQQEKGPLVVQGSNFSLSLDPERYPVLPAADGGRIVIDAGMTLSPFVKTILREKDPGIRIVSENPDNRMSFFSSLLAAARFYSVEENFSVDFGSDPKMTVTSDFKIEKSSESLLKNDVVLVNISGRHSGMPQPLCSFLDTEGFHVIESSPAYSKVPDGSKVLYCIEGSNQEIIVDELFSALSVRYGKNRDLVLDDGAVSGVTMSVRADRYVDGADRKVVFSFSEENPVQYTLLRLLELKGYRVVMLNPNDDFRELSEKVLSALGLPAAYGMHPLWVADETPFTVQLSGFVVSGSAGNKSRTFLTNVTIDPLVRDLARYQGFDVIVK
jgi:hypothetical protein